MKESHTITPPNALRSLSMWTESTLQADSALQEIELDSQLRDKVGAIGKSTVRLSTRCFAGTELSALYYAKITDCDGLQRSFTIIGLPRETSAQPILGIDLIAFGRSLSLVALDLAPTRQAYWHRNAEPILSKLREMTGSLKDRKVPEFTQGAFSELAVIAGAPSGTEEVATHAARRLLESYLRLPTELTSTPSPEDRDVRHWCRAELNNRKEHNALAGVFGAEFARTYLNFLFRHDGARKEAA